MRRLRMAVLIAVAVLVALSAAIALATRRPLPRGGEGPRLYVEVLASAPEGRQSQSGLGLALNGMSADHQAELTRALGDLADQLEVRRNPLVENLDDDDGQKTVARLIEAHLPALTAAAALAEGEWSSADHGMTVQVSGRCAPGAKCFPLDSPAPRGPSEQRARFLAWCVADAILLRAHSESEARRAAMTLRDAPLDRTRIALVLRNPDLHRLRWSVELGRLASSLERVTRLVPADEDSALARLIRKLTAPKGGARGDDDWVPWLQLPDDSILVVPRLSALATLSQFVAEVQSRLAAVGVEYVYLPR